MFSGHAGRQGGLADWHQREVGAHYHPHVAGGYSVCKGVFVSVKEATFHRAPVCDDARRESASALCVPGTDFRFVCVRELERLPSKSASLSVHAVSVFLSCFCRPGSRLTRFTFPDQYGMEPADSATSDIDRLVLRNKNLRDAHFINTWIGQVRLASFPLAFSTHARTRSRAHPKVPRGRYVPPML